MVSQLVLVFFQNVCAVLKLSSALLLLLQTAGLVGCSVNSSPTATADLAGDVNLAAFRTEVAFAEEIFRKNQYTELEIATLAHAVESVDAGTLVKPRHRGEVQLVVVSRVYESQEICELLAKACQSADPVVALTGVYGLGRVGCVNAELSRKAISEWLAVPGRSLQESEVGFLSLKLITECLPR